VTRIRLVATDLDGTLITHDGVVSVRTRDALAAVERAGMHLVFVTGRPPRWMASVVEATGHAGVAICANGAVVYDLRSESVESVRLLAAGPAREAVRRLREVLPDVAFAVERVGPARRLDIEFAREPGYVPRWPSPGDAPTGPAEELVDGGVVKLLARHPEHLGDALLLTAEAVLGGVAEVTHSNPADSLLEISALGVSKASTLEQLAASLGIGADEVVAFGDQPNDLPMLAWAGTSYAVANAHPSVLAAVDRHAAAVHDDGVAQVLETLLPPPEPTVR